jgi:hypothetical protein
MSIYKLFSLEKRKTKRKAAEKEKMKHLGFNLNYLIGSW